MLTDQPDGNITGFEGFQDIQRACCKRYPSQPGGPQGAGGFHIYFLAMFHIFSLVCFLIYGVKRRSGHDGSQSFCLIWHLSGPKMVV